MDRNYVRKYLKELVVEFEDKDGEWTQTALVRLANVCSKNKVYIEEIKRGLK